MTAFFRMGRDERAKRLAEAEEARHRIDRRKKGFRRRLEERFVEQTTAKVRNFVIYRCVHPRGLSPCNGYGCLEYSLITRYLLVIAPGSIFSTHVPILHSP